MVRPIQRILWIFIRRCIEVVVTRTTRNRFVQRWARGFESHHLRQKKPHLILWGAVFISVFYSVNFSCFFSKYFEEKLVPYLIFLLILFFHSDILKEKGL